MLIGREYLKNPILYASKDCHLSIFKASKYFRIDMEVVDTYKNGEIDYEHFESLLKKNKDRSALICLSVGTTSKGSSDNIDKVVSILKRNDFDKSRFHIHCDGELFSLLLPYIDQNETEISFEKPLGSISISGHKFLGF